MGFIYILRCGDGSLYTGIAKDLVRRLERHRLGKAPRYTRSRLPVILVWKRRLLTWSRALQESIGSRRSRACKRRRSCPSQRPEGAAAIRDAWARRPERLRKANLAGWTGLEPATSDVTGKGVR